LLIRRHLTELTLIAIAVIWALNFSIVKIALSEIDAFGFNALRYILAAALLIGYTKWLGLNLLPRREDFWPMVGIGIVGNLIYQVMFISGLDRTNAANAAVILGTIPVWVAFLSHIFTNEKLNLAKSIGITLAFGGVLLIIFGRNGAFSISTKSAIGDIITLGSAIAWASYTIMSKKYLKIYTTVQFTGFMSLIGVIGIVSIGIPSLVETDFSKISAGAFSGILYSGVLSIGLSYLIWNRAINKIGAIKTAAYQNLVPVLGLLFGVIILGENLGLIQYVGSFFVIIGIVSTQAR
jgi:drug/metabolite transporter (DMT)-like permease